VPLDPLLGIWILRVDSDSDGSVVELECGAWDRVSRFAVSGHVGAGVQGVRGIDMMTFNESDRCGDYLLRIATCRDRDNATLYLRSTSCYFGIKAPWKHGKQVIETTSRDSQLTFCTASVLARILRVGSSPNHCGCAEYKLSSNSKPSPPST
jgi:hypothetical protein